MGTKIETKLIVVSVLFVIVGALIYNIEEIEVNEKPSIRSFFKNIDRYKIIQTSELKPELVEMLNLDDYLYADFQGPDERINLYIGYYYNANKAYASHSPLICYPSQGWEILGKEKKKSMKIGHNVINYHEIITKKDQTKELVLFWYQSYSLSSTQIYKNKISMGYNKLTGKNGQHAFIRVSVHYTDSNNANENATEFIKTFYPKLINYFTLQ